MSDDNNDWYNRLVLAADIGLRDAALLRTYARWLKQTLISPPCARCHRMK